MHYSMRKLNMIIFFLLWFKNKRKERTITYLINKLFNSISHIDLTTIFIVLKKQISINSLHWLWLSLMFYLEGCPGGAASLENRVRSRRDLWSSHYEHTAGSPENNFSPPRNFKSPLRRKKNLDKKHWLSLSFILVLFIIIYD